MNLSLVYKKAPRYGELLLCIVFLLCALISIGATIYVRRLALCRVIPANSLALEGCLLEILERAV